MSLLKRGRTPGRETPCRERSLTPLHIATKPTLPRDVRIIRKLREKLEVTAHTQNLKRRSVSNPPLGAVSSTSDNPRGNAGSETLAERWLVPTRKYTDVFASESVFTGWSAKTPETSLFGSIRERRREPEIGRKAGNYVAAYPAWNDVAQQLSTLENRHCEGNARDDVVWSGCAQLTHDTPNHPAFFTVDSSSTYSPASGPVSHVKGIDWEQEGLSYWDCQDTSDGSESVFARINPSELWPASTPRGTSRRVRCDADLDVTSGTQPRTVGTPKRWKGAEFEKQENRTPGSISTERFTHPSSRRRLSLKTFRRFKKERQAIAEYWYKEFNSSVFHDRLPHSMQLEWSTRLTKTAGLCQFSHHAYSLSSDFKQQLRPFKTKLGGNCKILLSTKVLDCEDRLKKTLLHECCHAAQFLLEGETKPPHGPGFMKWASAASQAYPSLRVTVTHSYEIFAPYLYKCANCHQTYERHSKSINVDKQKCGRAGCRGAIVFVGTFRPDGTPARTTPAYVREPGR